MEEILSTVKRYNHQRGQVQAKLTVINKFIAELDSETIDQSEILLRLNQLPEIKRQYDEIVLNIICELDHEQIADSQTKIADQYAKSASFENEWCSTTIKLQKLVKPTAAVSQPQTQNPVRKFTAAIKLPEIQIPEFTGTYSQWLTFYNSFKSLVCDNDQLDDVAKLHYLRSSVKGEAFKVIQSIPLAPQNFIVAWSLLETRFQNNRLIVDDHVRAILSLPELAKVSYSALSNLLSEVKCHTEALKSLLVPINHWDAILVHIINNKLDYRTRELWAETLNAEVPNFSDFMKFLDSRCTFLKSFQEAGANNNHKPAGNNSHSRPLPKNNNRNVYSSVANLPTGKSMECALCQKAHGIHSCSEFLKLSVSDRINKITSLKLCKNCLYTNHKTSECKSRWRCRTCGRPHHSTLHIFETNSERLASNPHITENPSSSTNHCFATSKQVLLSTASIKIADKDGNWVDCRALLDGGSQIHCLSSALCQKLQLPVEKVNFQIAGINAINSQIGRRVTVTMQSRCTAFQTSMTCYVLDKVTQNLPSATFSKNLLKIPTDIFLADPTYNQSSPVDCLIGAELFWQLLGDERLPIPEHQLYITKSRLGWLLGGSLDMKGQSDNKSIAKATCNLSIQNDSDDLNQNLERFWLQEEVTNKSERRSSEEIACEKHFVENYKRDTLNGRFCVKLPLKNEPIKLGKSYQNALKRFLSLENKLDKNESLKAEYSQILREYLDLGYLERVPLYEITNENAYYLPHSAVIKESSSSTRVRIVFDGSAKTSNNLSLNDNLLNGPVIQDDLYSLLVRFRTYRYAMTADITKMYLQIELDKEQRDYQRLIWRENTNEPVSLYRLTRVIFGLTSSSFLSIRCLNRIAYDILKTHPSVSQSILKGFYVDDFLYGHNSLKEAQLLQRQLVDSLAGGGFNLTKWASNSPELLPEDQTTTASTSRSVVHIEGDKSSVTKALGMQWDCKSDVFSFSSEKILTSCETRNITKRSILSTISRCFDPLGLLSPFIIKAKLLMQDIWKINLGWDEGVPDHIQQSYLKFLNELKQINDLKIPRHAVAINLTKVQLHVFGDASVKAYGAAAFIRSEDASGNIAVHLLTSKSKVAPLRTITLPRLELNAAVLAVRLANKLSDDLSISIDINQTFFWTDSTIVYHWIAASANNWHVYVANRVQEIQNSTKQSQWGIVRSPHNPADLTTRGVSPEKLEKNSIWFRGPDFLSQNESDWPCYIQENHDTNQEIPERKTNVLAIAKVKTELPCFNKITNFNKLIRVIAYCLRFAHNYCLRFPCNSHKTKLSGPLHKSELDKAHTAIIRTIQSNHFPDEYNALSEGKPLKRQSKLIALDPFFDKNNLIRVGGRLRHAELPHDKKFPLILPKHHVTRLIIQQEHILNLHAGSQLTLAALRAKYWPISARSEIRKITRNCMRCFRVEPKLLYQKMGDLPKVRVEPSRPFINVTIDYFGPINIKIGTRRSTKFVKAYGIMFVCMATRAVHIELGGDLTTEAFLNVFKRFISRRGHVSKIYSDNGRNFVGAQRELKRVSELMQSSRFRDEFSAHFAAIEWHFMPPRSPNFGGLHERAIRSAKLHLKRVLGNASLTYESLLSPVEPDLQELAPNRLSRWRRLEQLRQHFWQRWSKEVLVDLQSRTKWRRVSAHNLEAGTMVLIAEDNIPPLMWKLGRVLSVHAGPDQLVRVATIKTATGVIKRSVRKLAVLPLSE